MAHRPAVDAGAMPTMFLAMNPPAFLVMGWVVMLAAMMFPTLIAPICHISLRSFTHRRVRSVALFISAYISVWMVACCAQLAIALVITTFAPRPYLRLASAIVLTLVWQVSPLKQRCLNGCHTETELAAFGAAADFAALRIGVVYAMWCVGSCWALMLLPMLVSRGHLFVMAVATVLIVSERLESPMPASWRWRGLGKTIRIIRAQARLRFTALGTNASLFSPSA